MGAESLEASNSTLDCVLCRAQAHTLLIIIDDGSFDISPVEGDMGLFQWHAVNRLSNGCEYNARPPNKPSKSTFTDGQPFSPLRLAHGV